MDIKEINYIIEKYKNEDLLDDSFSNVDTIEELSLEVKELMLYEKLGCTIEELKLFKDNKISIDEILLEKVHEYRFKNIIDKVKIKLIRKLIKNSSNKNEEKINEYLDEVIFFDSIDYTEKKEFNNLRSYSLITQLIFTIPLLGSHLWLFINMDDKDYDALKFNIPVAIITTIVLTLTWSYYFKNRKITTEKLYRRFIKGATIIVIFIGTILVSFSLFAGIGFIQEKLYLDSNNIFYIFKSPYSYFIFIFEVEILFYALHVSNRFIGNVDFQFTTEFIKFIKKHWITTLIINVCVLYLSLTEVVVVNEDRIIDYSCFNPGGKEYYYSDITKVEAGFNSKVFRLNGVAKGDFYYNVTFKDGETLEFINVTSKKYDTAYEIKAFDDIVMKGNVKKNVSSNNSNYSPLDKKYVEIYKGIISNT